MIIFFYLEHEDRSGALGKALGNGSMIIPPRIGEAVFVPGHMTHKRVVDVYWQPVDLDAPGDHCWANVVVKHDP